ncbi:MAG TPA: alkaline phosphatase family protein [Actinomycetota bacterium]|nr:alkaline phosphatase family protein [Actinomycetota bacterium]
MVRPSPILIVFALLGGVAALLVTAQGSIVAGVATGLVVWAIGVVAVWLGTRRSRPDGPSDAGPSHAGPSPAGPSDAGRRRFLVLTGAGGLAAVAAGAAIARVAKTVTRVDAVAAQDAGASRLGADYMELVRRAYHPDRSGELQLVLAPFNSSNYPEESLSLIPMDRRTSHASIWMYLQRIPLVAYGPGVIEPSDSEERVSLADLAPTTATLAGLQAWPNGRDGRVLPSLRTTGRRPKVVVTYVIDGGGWNVLNTWPNAWPELRSLMRNGANYRNAIVGSFPAITACAHATIGTGAFPWKHGITGHNIRDGADVRKAYGGAGDADPADILLSTLADVAYDESGGEAWVGEIGYQVWHLGMLGHGGLGRSEPPVGVYFDEFSRAWAPHHPERFRLPNRVPGIERLDRYRSSFTPLDVDRAFDPSQRQADCCSPPVVTYQGDLMEATFDSEPIGTTGHTDLLYTTYKAPDYAGHVYGMASPWEELVLGEVDAQLGRLVRMLEDRFPGEYVVFVTADHGQCPIPDVVDGVRLDPIQLGSLIEGEFGGLFDAVQGVYPHEVYLHADTLWDAGADVDDVAAFIRDLRYRQNIGPYVPRDAIQQDLLDQRQFAAVFSVDWLARLRDVDPARFGSTTYTGDGVDIGLPPPV